MRRAATAVLLLAACGGSPDVHHPGNRGNADIVNPTGNDAFIVINAPQTTQGNLRRIEIDGGGASDGLALGQPLRVIPGHHCIRYDMKRPAECFDLQAGQTKTYTFAAYSIVAGLIPFGLTTDLAQPLNGQGTPNLDTFTVGASDWIPPGTVHIKLGFNDGFDVTLPEGKVTPLDFSSLAQRRAAMVKQPNNPAFADALCTYNTFGSSETTRMHSRVQTLPASTAMGVRQSQPDSYGDFIGQYGEVDFIGYELVLYFPSEVCNQFCFENACAEQCGEGPERVSQHITLPLSAKAGDPAAVLQLGRIDVNDVAVKQPDGSRLMVAGAWTLAQKQADGSFTPFFPGCQFGTKSGVTVPPGAYQVTTTYSVGGQTATDVKSITIR
jgi:hypothetical protein